MTRGSERIGKWITFRTRRKSSIQMMKAIGIEGLEALFADIPEKYRLKKLLDIPPPLSEQEIWEHMTRLAGA